MALLEAAQLPVEGVVRGVGDERVVEHVVAVVVRPDLPEERGVALGDGGGRGNGCHWILK